MIFYCILYLLVLSILIYISGRVFPRDMIREKAFPYACYKWEKEGKIYERLWIRKWKNKYPDASRIIHKIIKKVPEKSLKSRSAAKVLTLIKESCVAEATHLLAVLGAIPAFFLFGKWGGFISSVYVIANLPAIIIQRYNRPRLIRVLCLYEKKESVKAAQPINISQRQAN